MGLPQPEVRNQARVLAEHDFKVTVRFESHFRSRRLILVVLLDPSNSFLSKRARSHNDYFVKRWVPSLSLDDYIVNIWSVYRSLLMPSLNQYSIPVFESFR